MFSAAFLCLSANVSFFLFVFLIYTLYPKKEIWQTELTLYMCSLTASVDIVHRSVCLSFPFCLSVYPYKYLDLRDHNSYGYQTWYQYVF